MHTDLAPQIRRKIYDRLNSEHTPSVNGAYTVIQSVLDLPSTYDEWSVEGARYDFVHIDANTVDVLVTTYSSFV